MPKVGKKEFPYTEAGVEAAEQYAEGTNQKIDTSRNYPSSNAMDRKETIMGYGDGGKVKKYHSGGKVSPYNEMLEE